MVPLPDYKLPVTVLHEAALAMEESDFPVAPFMRNSVKYGIRGMSSAGFSLESAIGVLARNGLVRDLCDSFFYVAGADASCAAPLDPRILVSHYGGKRLPAYAKETRFVRREDGSIRVERRLLAPGNGEKGALRLTFPADEPYVARPTLQDKLIPILNTPGWNTARLAAWAGPWLLYLVTLPGGEETPGDKLLPGRCLDMIPMNCFVDEKGGIIPFDDEWSYADGRTLSFKFVALHGLILSLSWFATVAPPRKGTPLTLVDIARDVLERNGVDVTPAEQRLYLAQFREFMLAATGGAAGPRQLEKMACTPRLLA
jgi:hypothetical protein